MSYTQGGLIEAADLNSFVDMVNSLWGVGDNDRGYGQAGADIPHVAPETSIMTSTDWATLQTRVLTMAQYQDYSANVPSAGVFAAGQTATAFTSPIPSAGQSLQALLQPAPAVNSLDTLRVKLSAPHKQTVNLNVSTRNTSWTTGLVHEVRIDFGTEDNARYFFNSGSQIWIDPSRTGGSATGENTNWTNMLNTVGTVVFAHRATTSTGSAGTAANLGYYGLTDINQQIYAVTSGGTYSGAQYRVFARRGNYAGLRGANGSQVIIRVQFDDTDPDPKDGTLTDVIGMYQANQYIIAPTPTPTLITGL